MARFWLGAIVVISLLVFLSSGYYLTKRFGEPDYLSSATPSSSLMKAAEKKSFIARSLRGDSPSSRPVVKIGDVSITVEVRRTPAELSAGLSGRPSLPADEGMLFVFRTKDRHAFWMPDMNFPIDIIWIDEGRIVGIEHQVSNNFDPDNPVFYRPPVPVQYVLETNAGFAAAHDFRVGEAVDLSNIR